MAGMKRSTSAVTATTSITAAASGEILDDLPAEFAPPEAVIGAFKRGEMVLLVDDEDRENEGDIVAAADSITPEQINFMAREARGLICLALDEVGTQRLGLDLQPRRNSSRFDTAFTVSIEARTGVTTGTSAFDRAVTILSAVKPTSSPEDITTPGHVFPVVARNGGVLVRAGHTEATVDFARLAGRMPAGVMCEVLSLDGTMARMDELRRFATHHKLLIGKIEDLIAWRMRRDRTVRRISEVSTGPDSDGRCIIYRNLATGTEYAALVYGEPDVSRPVLARMHRLDPASDMLTARLETSIWHRSLAEIRRVGVGVAVLMQDDQPASLLKDDTNPDLKAVSTSGLLDQGTSQNNLREIGVGAQILLDLGIRNVELLSNHERSVVGLHGFGIDIVKWRPIP